MANGQSCISRAAFRVAAQVDDLPPPVRLTEYDETEWRSIAKRLKPEWSDEEIKAEWDKFQALKVFKRLN